jgi:hypothetical protein
MRKRSKGSVISVFPFFHAWVPQFTVPMHEKLPAHRLVIAAGKVETYLTGYGSNGGSTVNRKLGHYSTSGGTLMVLDQDEKGPAADTDVERRALARGKSCQQSRLCGHYVERLACRGCIVVYAPE